MNIGHYLNPLGVRTVLVGKSHMVPDQEGMERLGIDRNGPIGTYLAEAGWEVYERDDGIHSDTLVKPDLNYNNYLESRGYTGENPWHWVANSVSLDQEVRWGYLNDRVDLPARVSEEDSETPYMTRRAMEFLAEDDGKTPWVLHLSYIKPHRPYVAPAPYNNMYSADDVVPAIKSDLELDDPNELMSLFRTRVGAKTLGRDEARARIIPAYMGLISQIDDQLGVLLDFIREREFAISERDYSFQTFGLQDGREPLDCRSNMIVTKDWKYIDSPGFDPVLFDLVNDPDEVRDLGRDPDHAATVQDMFNKLAGWSLQYRQRVSTSEERARFLCGIEEKLGVLIGFWNEKDVGYLDPKVVPWNRPLSVADGAERISKEGGTNR